MAHILQILENPMVFTAISFALPLLLLLLYVVLDRIAPKTSTKVDDELKAGLGEILEGLGKPVPTHIEASEALRLQALKNGLPSAKKPGSDDPDA